MSLIFVENSRFFEINTDGLRVAGCPFEISNLSSLLLKPKNNIIKIKKIMILWSRRQKFLSKYQFHA